MENHEGSQDNTAEKKKLPEPSSHQTFTEFPKEQKEERKSEILPQASKCQQSQQVLMRAEEVLKAIEDTKIQLNEIKMDMLVQSFNLNCSPKPNQIEKLSSIITFLQDNKSFEIVYNSSEYLKSGRFVWFDKNELPFSFDNMKIFKGVVFDNFDLGLCDIELIRTLSESISTNTSIKVLSIQNDATFSNGNSFNIQCLANAFFKNRNIKGLYLSNNDLGNGIFKNIEVIFNAICSNGMIKWLDLSNNDLGNGNLKNIEIIFNSISNINGLSLSNNDLGNGNYENVDFILKSVSEKKELKHLDLGNNDWQKGSKNYDLIMEIKKKKSGFSFLCAI